MARVVPCPACGHAHPFGDLAPTPTFACAECGRTLRTPTQLVQPPGPGPGPDRRPVSDAPSPSPDVGPPRVESPSSPSTPSSPKRRSSAVPVPWRVAAWIVAVAAGLFFAWLIASGFGLLSRPILVDMFRSSTATNYWRLALFVPLWAFMSATAATVLIETTRWLRARRAGDTPRRDRRSKHGGGDEAKRPALAHSIPDIDEPPPTVHFAPPGQRTRIRPGESPR